jgi:hypothetical protein
MNDQETKTQEPTVTGNEDFTRMASSGRQGLTREMLQWMAANKKWWLLPLVAVLLLLGLFVIFSGPLGAFIYPLI